MADVIEVLPLGWSESGEPIRVPTGATGWRVKLYRPGVKKPDLVRDEYGMPAMIPLQATPEEFRSLMGAGGRYRLEPVFSDGRSIADSEPALIILREKAEEVAVPQQQQQVGGIDSNELILRLIEQHSESTNRTHELLNEMMSDHRAQVTALAAQNTALVTTLAQNFGSYISSSAELLKSSYSPAIAPPVPAPELVYVSDDSDNDDPEPAEESPYTELVAEGVRSVMPLITQVIHKCVLGLSSEQTAALQGDPPPAPATTAPEAAASEPTPTKAAPPTPKTTAAPATPKAPDFVEHLNAIEKHLTPKEVAAARSALTSMTPQTITAWRDQLLTLSPPDAAAQIRAQLAPRKASA